MFLHPAWRRAGNAMNSPAMTYWISGREDIYPKIALDLVSAPAFSAFVEWFFFCALLSSGLRNQDTTFLEQRVFLKINKKIFD